jgi:PhoPQ-activated pathogenicity-related protein
MCLTLSSREVRDWTCSGQSCKPKVLRSPWMHVGLNIKINKTKQQQIKAKTATVNTQMTLTATKSRFTLSASNEVKHEKSDGCTTSDVHQRGEPITTTITTTTTTITTTSNAHQGGKQMTSPELLVCLIVTGFAWFVVCVGIGLADELGPAHKWCPCFCQAKSV